MIITSFRNQSQQYCYHTEHNNTWNHLVFLAETFSWSSFTSDQQISDDLFLQQILDDLYIKSKISENLFFTANSMRSFHQKRKYGAAFFSSKSENIWWSSFPTNQKISDDLLFQQIRTVFLPGPPPLSHCLQSCWYLVKKIIGYLLQLAMDFWQILRETNMSICTCSKIQLGITGQMCQFCLNMSNFISKKTQPVFILICQKKNTCW